VCRAEGRLSFAVKIALQEAWLHVQAICFYFRVVVHASQLTGHETHQHAVAVITLFMYFYPMCMQQTSPECRFGSLIWCLAVKPAKRGV